MIILLSPVYHCPGGTVPSIKKARFHGLIGHGSAPFCDGQPYSAFTAMTSTSASTPLGSAFTATQERAGLPVKYFA